jgi:hypothetical protein
LNDSTVLRNLKKYNQNKYKARDGLSEAVTQASDLADANTRAVLGNLRNGLPVDTTSTDSPDGPANTDIETREETVDVAGVAEKILGLWRTLGV